MKKIPILICVDAEPDERLISSRVQEDWKGFEKSFEFIMELRSRLEATTGRAAHFTWFFRMDPQISSVYGSGAWAVARYGNLVKEIEAAGDEIGLHTHAWRRADESQHWFQDFADQQWIEYCVRSSFEAFEKSLGRPCSHFRFGDRWMNDATIKLVEQLGARFDLTVEPGHKEKKLVAPSTGALPDYTEIPRHPYRPSKADFKRHDADRDQGLWIIPISTGSLDWANTLADSSISKTPAIEAQGPPPVYEGYLDRADSREVLGWVWDMNRPALTLNAEIYDGDTLLATVGANAFRPDLLEAGKGNGKHAFRYAVPHSMRDGKRHSIRVKVAGTDFELHSTNSEVNLIADDNDCEEFITMNLCYHPFIPCLIMEKLLMASKDPYLALVFRSDAFIRPDQRASLNYNINYLLTHPEIKRFAFVTPPQMIKEYH